MKPRFHAHRRVKAKTNQTIILNNWFTIFFFLYLWVYHHKGHLWTSNMSITLYSVDLIWEKEFLCNVHVLMSTLITDWLSSLFDTCIRCFTHFFNFLWCVSSIWSYNNENLKWQKVEGQFVGEAIACQNE